MNNLPLFLIGAGFNVDANRDAAGDARYPLGTDLPEICGFAPPPPGQSVEDAFQQALEHNPHATIEALKRRLMAADDYLASTLALEGPNRYWHFFKTYSAADFLTFNYDSLAETFLHRLGAWYPHDGYGVRVQTSHPFHVSDSGEAAELRRRESSSHVLHLHGSFCLYTWEEPRNGILQGSENAQFAFIPAQIAGNFGGNYDTVHRALAGERPIIAPVRNKARRLAHAHRLIHRMYERAVALAANCRTLVAIGYNFGPHDRASYRRILCAFSRESGRKLIVVSPNAGELAYRLRPEYPHLVIEPIPSTFVNWMAAGCPPIAERLRLNESFGTAH